MGLLAGWWKHQIRHGCRFGRGYGTGRGTEYGKRKEKRNITLTFGTHQSGLPTSGVVQELAEEFGGNQY